MSEWLNSTNEPIPPTEGGNAPENMAPTSETVPAAEPQTAAASEVPPEQLPPVNTWTAPADNACTYHYANPNPPVQQTTPADGGWQGSSPYGGTQTPAYGAQRGLCTRSGDVRRADRESAVRVRYGRRLGSRR